MKKKTFIISVLFVIVFVGVFYLRAQMPWYREEVSAETFEKAAGEAGFVTEDVLYRYGGSGEGVFDAVIEVRDPDKKSLITFYDLNLGGSSENAFEFHFKELEQKQEKDNIVMDTGSSYQWAELVTDDRYFFLAMVENTLLNVDADISDRQMAEELINTINYR